MKRSQFVLLLLAGIAVHLAGLLSDIFLVDSSLYAIISKQMSVSGDYLNLYVNGEDWLDKPHFPFWVCALSMDLFGINTFAYKLPSLLFFFLGVYYTYKLAAELYDRSTAQIAVLILISGLHLIISNNDVRAESIMIGVIMGAIYHMYRMSRRASFVHLFLAALFTAASIMTKGIFVLVMIYAAVGLPILWNGQYRKLLHWKWPLLLIATAIFTLPEIYAVYQQFDLHPEKTVFGQQGVSGVRFFLWDSQFGRFFNTGPIQGQGDPSYFLHTMLWAFAPWAILGYWALWTRGKDLFRRDVSVEPVTFFGFIFLFLLFSLSSFQLAHYTNILFPLLAILSAGTWVAARGDLRVQKLICFSLNLYAVVALAAMAILTFYARLGNNWLTILILLALLSAIACYYKKKLRHIVFGYCIGLLLGAFLNLSFYPNLLKYQSGSATARYIQEYHPDKEVVVTLFEDDFLFPFYYSGRVVTPYTYHAPTYDDLPNDDQLYLYNESVLKDSSKRIYPMTIVKEFPHYHISQLNFAFLNPNTRKDVLEKRLLVSYDTSEH